jgi:hypothetical protein
MNEPAMMDRALRLLRLLLPSAARPEGLLFINLPKRFGR